MIFPTHLLDTSVYSQPIRRKPGAAVQRRWEALGDDRVCTSIICEAELLTGLEIKGSPKLWRAYRSTLEGRIPVLGVDGAVARHYAELAAEARRKGHPRPGFDLLIAATARAHGLTLATLNAKHFVGLEGVAVEDWAE